ncbi:MAG: type I-E CRISPR-associated protein Cas5/CasD [Acidobacteriota bacterium]
MPTLLMRLAGPMQSWGTESRFSIRDAGREPSKSGVIGLLCAAMGKPRFESPDDGFPSLSKLASLKMGVRVDSEGVLKRDFHTAGGSHRRGEKYGVAKADGSKPGTVVSTRWYLSDASFLVGLESEDADLLRYLDVAIANPQWQLSLGRKAFAPSMPVRLKDGLRQEPLREVLGNYPWDGSVLKESPERLRAVLDATPETASEVRHDLPLSFAARRFTIRYVITDFISFPKGGE